MTPIVSDPSAALPCDNWRVLILSRHAPQAASSRLRTFQYIPFLQAAGAQVSVSPFFDATYLSHLYKTRGDRRLADVARAYFGRLKAVLVGIRDYDVVWVEKEVFPFLPGAFEALLRLSGVPYVVDYDDATFHSYDQHRSALVRRVLGRKLTPLLSHASAVTVGNSYLESHLRRLGAKRVYQVPTVVDIDRYVAATGELPSFHRSSDLRVGWIGTPATTKYLQQLAPALSRVATTHPLRLVTIGASPLPDFPVPIEQHAWSADSEAMLLRTLDVGVMPLPDEPWERGKCGYKLIQYMASGLPVVASPVGVNKDIVTAEIGRLATTTLEWADALVDLASSHSLRISLGRAGRLRAEQNYALQAVAPRVVALLARTAERALTAPPAGSPGSNLGA